MRALIIEQINGTPLASVKHIVPDALPDGDVTVDIDWSALNYKDALAITGRGKIIRQFPMIPGIDFAGRVHHSDDPRFHQGQVVLLTGWGVGERHWGGLAEQARVSADWLMPMPHGLDGRQAMAIGTAGLTAMLCVMALEEGGVQPSSGDIVVTGASGGVGSCSIALLHALGYQVTAVSGRESTHEYLYQLGAKTILPREVFTQETRPLATQRFAGAVDTAGGKLLAGVLTQIHYGGVVAACGLAAGFALPATVMPFILRNIRLQGVDSVSTPMPQRMAAWEKLVTTLPPTFYHHVVHDIPLSAVIDSAHQRLSNRLHGRTRVDIRQHAERL